MDAFEKSKNVKLPFIHVGESVGYKALPTTNFTNPHTTKNRYELGKSFDGQLFGVNKSLDIQEQTLSSFNLLGAEAGKVRPFNGSILNSKPKKLTYQQKQQHFRDKIQQSIELRKSILGQDQNFRKGQESTNVGSVQIAKQYKSNRRSKNQKSHNWRDSQISGKPDHILRVTARSPEHQQQSELPSLDHRGSDLKQAIISLNSRKILVAQSLNTSVLDTNIGSGLNDGQNSRNQFQAQLTSQKQRHLSYQQSPRIYSPHPHDGSQTRSMDRDESTISIQLVHQIIKNQADRQSKGRIVPWPGCDPRRHAQVLVQGQGKQIHVAPHLQMLAYLPNIEVEQPTVVVEEVFPNLSALGKIGSMQKLEQFGEDLLLDGQLHTELSISRDEDDAAQQSPPFSNNLREMKALNKETNEIKEQEDVDVKLIINTKKQQIFNVPTQNHPTTVVSERHFDNTMTSDTLSVLGRLEMGSKMQHSSPLRSPAIQEEQEQKPKGKKKGEKKIKKNFKSKKPYLQQKQPINNAIVESKAVKQIPQPPPTIPEEPSKGLLTTLNNRESAQLLASNEEIIYNSESKRSLIMNPNNSSKQLELLRSIQEKSQQGIMDEYLGQHASSLDLSLQKDNTKSLKNMLSGMEEKTMSLKNILSDMDNQHLSQLNSRLLSEVLAPETTKDSKVQLTKILNRSDLPNNRKVDLKKKNHTIDIEYQVQRFRHLRTISEVQTKVLPFAKHKMPKRHNQKALMMAISKYQSSKQSRLASELHYYQRELDKFEKVLGKSISPPRLANIPSVQLFDGKDLQNTSELVRVQQQNSSVLNFKQMNLIKQRSSTGKDSDVNDTFSMFTTQQLFKNNMISNVVQEAPFMEEENSMTNMKGQEEDDRAQNGILGLPRDSLVYVVQSGENEGDDLLDREQSAHQTVLGKQFPSKQSSQGMDGYHNINESKLSSQLNRQTLGIASIIADESEIDLGKTLQPKKAFNIKLRGSDLDLETDEQNLQVIGRQKVNEVTHSLKEEDRIAENLKKVKKAAQLAVTQGNFELRSSSPGKSKVNVASLNQDLFDDLEGGKHMDREIKMKPTKIATGRISPQINAYDQHSPSQFSKNKISARKSPNLSPMSRRSQNSPNRSQLRSPVHPSSPIVFPKPLTKMKAKIIARQSPKLSLESKMKMAGTNLSSIISKHPTDKLQTNANFNQLAPGVQMYLPEQTFGGISSQQPETLFNTSPDLKNRALRTIIITQEPTPPGSHLTSVQASRSNSPLQLKNLIKHQNQHILQGTYGNKVAFQKQQRVQSLSPQQFQITPAPKFIISSLQQQPLEKHLTNFQKDKKALQSEGQSHNLNRSENKLINDLNAQRMSLANQQQQCINTQKTTFNQKRRERKEKPSKVFTAMGGQLNNSHSTLEFIKKLNQQSKSRVKLAINTN